MPTQRHTFPRSHRIGGRGAFRPIMDAGVKITRGPLLIFAAPNAYDHPRIGISISRKVGNAVRRNRIRRLIREAYRLLQHDFTKPVDLILIVRPHEPLDLKTYQRHLISVVQLQSMQE